ncbi:hypothetical protein BOTBODRAFT_30448 [Botryobasidium botryosum FD-172 SS1]|uniref:Uncharacterized protein n=1 Tax=Botryobasidium botryosum (strain FD-172 SS1) TaxID=930990 RepID=A0A067MNC5_BOTB1|nr:hypothetical protein BOTBODRAFT_30448 [Botryobasidium botryosum FD-172 SS1]
MQAGWTTRRQSCRQASVPREQDVKGTIDGGRLAFGGEALTDKQKKQKVKRKKQHPRVRRP